jgi:nucleotide-binding universal stress UspA family protein
MTALATKHRTRAPTQADRPRPAPAPRDAAPIVVSVDGSAAGKAAVEAAVRLAARIDAPVVFAYVRRGPAGFLGTPYYQQRLSAAMERARRALDDARRVAAEAGVVAEGEILEGSPRKRILELAEHRGARLVIVGRGVSRAAARAAKRPVVVARPGRPPAVVAGRRAGKNPAAPHTDQ